MIDNLKEQEIERINTNIEILEQQKSGIEEKYRKLMEEETEKINAALESYKTLLDFWSGNDITVAEKPKRKRRTKAEMEAARLAELADDEKVVDTLIPENNEDHVEDIPESVVESGTVIEDTESVSEDDSPEFDGAGFTAEGNVVEAEEPVAEVAEETADADDDSWPEFPSEWK